MSGDQEAATRRLTFLSRVQIDLTDANWRAANYLSVGQIHLLDNPLLREPLKIEHAKPRLLGHWGTTPGMNFLCARRLGQRVREVPRGFLSAG